MRPFKQTMPLEEARRLIDQRGKPVERLELLQLHDANGRVLAQDVVAAADVPPFARAGMDGYAVRGGETAGATRQSPKTLTRVARIFTGQVPGRAVGPGECAEIATGAPMPDGADAVVMVEETEADSGGTISVFTPVTPGQNVGRRGADISAGQTVLRGDDVLNASRIGALAALGMTEVNVYAKPRVAILSTGDEIVEPGRPLEPGRIYDINRFTLGAVVGEHGGLAEPRRAAGDTLEALSYAFDESLDSDLVLLSGGSSVGERDLIIDVLSKKGVVIFHGIAVKPGKPTAFGVIGDTPVFGLPGYPTSCLSNAYILVVPLLRRMARLPPHRVKSLTLPLGQRVVSTPGRHQFFTVRIGDGVVLPAFKASGDITSMSQADGYIEIPTDVAVVEQGEMVEVKLF